jgi:NAD(P)-dependent dehydrogenase (short-subunit alcohol dehydrogenase family)
MNEMSDQMKFVSKLQGARVLIIGGTSGIGFAAAEASIEYGAAKVMLASSREMRVQNAIARLKKAYPSSKADMIGYVCNLGDEDTIESNIRDLFKQVGELDHIIYTAGDSPMSTPFLESDYAYIRKGGVIRFYGPILVARYGYKNLVRSPKSSLTLTSGATSEKPIEGYTATSAWLSSLHGMIRGLALDLRPVRVNLICPGAIDTEMWDVQQGDARAATIATLVKDTTVGVVGKPEDIAEAYIYCMKDHFVTGSIIDSNGGRFLISQKGGDLSLV